MFDIDTTHPQQTIDGFGGAFNEKGWDAMSGMKADEREKILKDLFGQNGLNLNIGRIPIGANDYSMDYYSLDDTPADYELKNFSMGTRTQISSSLFKSRDEISANTESVRLSLDTASMDEG